MLVTLGLVLCVVPGIYFGVAWSLSVPLVIDKQLETAASGFPRAVKGVAHVHLPVRIPFHAPFQVLSDAKDLGEQTVSGVGPVVIFFYIFSPSHTRLDRVL